MYLISAYFDEKSGKMISEYIERIAEKTGNTFMTKNQVPPHLTISSLEARGEDVLLPHFEGLQMKAEISVFFATVGMFFPYVIYLAPVLNEQLLNLSKWIYKSFCEIPDVQISRFYKPFQWFPHVTLGKTLSQEEMRIAFEVMQNSFVPFEGRIVSLGLAKVNPHEDLCMIVPGRQGS
ncbi:MAG: hypothetical protein IJ733_11005 [Lachnospiraceae bacterium]|nr:hypothetical protein [Lachnospiraceae bacterium]